MQKSDKTCHNDKFFLWNKEKRTDDSYLSRPFLFKASLCACIDNLGVSCGVRVLFQSDKHSTDT